MTNGRNSWLIRTLQIILGVAGLGALTLGLLFWIANIQLIGIHMLFGLLVALSLLVISFMALFARNMRIWGIVGVVYALFVPIFGLSQASILTGDLHWLIRTLHLLVGLGALFLAGRISVRYLQAKNTRLEAAAEPQVTR